MKFKGQFDDRELIRAMIEVERETGKAWPDILNKVGKDIAFRAWQFTPFAHGAKLTKWIAAPLIQRLVLSRIAKGQDKEYGAGAHLTREELSDAVHRRVKKILASSKYIRTGWVNAVLGLGGKISARKMHVSRKGLARYGGARKAQVARLITEIWNTATGAEKISGPALQQAIDFKAADLRKYLEKKLSATMGKHSAK